MSKFIDMWNKYLKDSLMLTNIFVTFETNKYYTCGQNIDTCYSKLFSDNNKI